MNALQREDAHRRALGLPPSHFVLPDVRRPDECRELLPLTRQAIAWVLRQQSLR